jgi:hypothetical protein
VTAFEERAGKYPPRNSALQAWLPTKPAPPVTRMVFIGALHRRSGMNSLGRAEKISEKQPHHEP